MHLKSDCKYKEQPEVTVLIRGQTESGALCSGQENSLQNNYEAKGGNTNSNNTYFMRCVK